MHSGVCSSNSENDSIIIKESLHQMNMHPYLKNLLCEQTISSVLDLFDPDPGNYFSFIFFDPKSRDSRKSLRNSFRII